MTNFVSQHTHIYNEKGFCTICGQYQPAVYNKSTDVYTINNAGQLFWFSSLVNGDHSYADFDKQNAGANAELAANIDLENKEWAPVNNYKGNFNGKGHSILNLNISKASDYTGLFGSVMRAVFPILRFTATLQSKIPQVISAVLSATLIWVLSKM